MLCMHHCEQNKAIQGNCEKVTQTGPESPCSNAARDDTANDEHYVSGSFMAVL